MAVKVRCPECSKSLNAPDAARGKAVKCPGCGGKVPVPAGDAPQKAVSKTAAPAKAKAKAKAPSDADFLARLDLDSVEDENIRLCPKCGAHLNEEDEECPECGVDTRTGQLSAKRRRKMSMKGPDPSLFYRAAWAESFEFLKENWGVPLKLAVMLAVFAMISTFAQYANAKYCNFAESPPPALFWMGVSALFIIGIPGMLATIMQQIVVHSMEEREKDYKAQYDMFGAVGNGVKYIAWFVIMPLPFFFTGIIYLLPLVCFPIAVIHMTRPYAHPAWLPWDMLRITAKNLAPCLYILMMAVALLVPALAIAGVVAYLLMGLGVSYLPWLAGQLSSLAGGSATEGFIFAMMEALIVMALSFVAALVSYIVLCFPQVFLMRTIGEFGYYFKNRLELVNKIPKHQLAGFWPRYLAYMIDGMMIFFILAAISAVAGGVCGAYAYMNGVPFAEFIVSPLGNSIIGLFNLIYIGACLFYWASFESSAAQGTLGMRSIGLKVIDLKGNRISFGTAAQRFVMRNIGGPIIFCLGWIMCAFNEKKQTLHDMTTKTLVVWEGD